MRQTIIVEDGDEKRLDAFLSVKGGFLSREKAKEAVKNGKVYVNGILSKKPATPLSPEDEIGIEEVDTAAGDVHIIPVDVSLKVLYEDEACLVIAKPRGISVHPALSIAKDEATILHGVAHLFKERDLPFDPSAVLAHRLDKETTGCLLVAKTPAAHLALQKQFADRTVHKDYLALVDGVPSHPEAMIDAPIGRHVNDRTKMSVHGAGKAREAQTSFVLVGSSSDCSLLRCTLHTGRTHQIRVHLKSIGHPVLGDPTYFSSASKDRAEELDISFLCLHAWTLAFQSPASTKKTEVTCPVPADFSTLLDGLHLSPNASA